MQHVNWSWTQLIGPNSPYVEKDFIDAASLLHERQIVYESDNRVQYQIIARHSSAYRALFALLGIDVEIDDELRLAALVPLYPRPNAHRLEETLTLLVLRKIYHDHATQAALTENMAVITIDDFLGAYRAETGREPPEGTTKELESALEPARRYGMVKLIKGEDRDRSFDIAIRPGITKIISESTLGLLAQHHAHEIAKLKVRTEGKAVAEENLHEPAL